MPKAIADGKDPLNKADTPDGEYYLLSILGNTKNKRLSKATQD